MRKLESVDYETSSSSVASMEAEMGRGYGACCCEAVLGKRVR